MWDSIFKKYLNILLGSDVIKFFFDNDRKEYFLDRDLYMFRYIFNFYCDGKLYFLNEDCVGVFCEELFFYGINVENINDCCLEEFSNFFKKIYMNE